MKDKKKIVKFVYHEVSDFAYDLIQEHTEAKAKSKIRYICPREFSRLNPDAKKGANPKSEERPMWRNPCHFQLKFKTWDVCHGNAHHTWDREFAWVEKDGYAIDLSEIPEDIYFSVIAGKAPAQVCEEFIRENRVPVKRFYKIYSIANVKKYSPKEARELMDYYQTYGVWKGAPRRYG